MTADREELTVTFDVPEVCIDVVRVNIACGDTSVAVAEHGMEGSGDWCVWTSRGHTLELLMGQTYQEATAAAAVYVRATERVRVALATLRSDLGAAR